MTDCAEVEQLRDLYVLGALPPDAFEEVETHLETCAECRDQVHRSWALAQLLRLGVPQVQPPAELGSRILGAAMAAGPGGAAADVARLEVPGGGGRWRIPPFASAFLSVPVQWRAAAALVPLIVGGWLAIEVVLLQRQVETTELALRRSWQNAQAAAEILGRGMEAGAPAVRVSGTEMAPAARGMLYYGATNYECVLVVDGLPRAAADRAYKLWLVSGEERVSGGTLYVGEDGRGMLVVKSPVPLGSLDRIDVTLEPHRDSAGPTGERYMWGRLKASSPPSGSAQVAAGPDLTG